MAQYTTNYVVGTDTIQTLVSKINSTQDGVVTVQNNTVPNTDASYLAIKNTTYIAAGNGISVSNGTNQQTVAVKAATSSAIGGVIVSGTGLTIDASGNLGLASNIAKTDASGQTFTAPQIFQDAVTIGNGNADVLTIQSATIEADSRTINLTYTNGQLTSVTEVDPTNSNTTVKTTNLTYTAGQLTKVVDTVGVHNSTYNLNYSAGQLSTVTHSYS